MNTITTETAGNPALTEKIVTFINSIGISCREAQLDEGTFLPGIDIQNGVLLYDKALLEYPSDLLHDAGHIAVLSHDDRQKATSPNDLNGDLEAPAAEMAAIAWSWAAAQYLNIPQGILFHSGGYKDSSEWLAENFSQGNYLGLPILQWQGMSKAPSPGVEPDAFTFPKMKHWLRPGPEVAE